MAEGERLTYLPEGGDGPGPEPPHPNGAVVTSGNARSRRLRRRIFLGGLVAFVGLWAFAITYSVTAGGRSPERLTDADARAVEHACVSAQQDLGRLSQVSAKATPPQRAARVEQEDARLTAMIGRIRAVHPAQKTPAVALADWLGDWQRLVTARQHFASDLRTKGDDARFVEPATAGVDPIADKMNNWILEQGTRTQACNTGQLQAEVVEGPRTYGSASNS